MLGYSSWKFWVIVALALGTLACAGRRERREQAREDRRERAEQRRADRQEQLERKRAEREGQRVAEAPAVPPPAAAAAPVAVLTPVAASATAPDAASRVVFMRVSKQSGGIDASLFDVSEPGEPKFIGVINNASKISYSLKPGLYTFMVVGETAEFMQATVAGGKTYYALVIPSAGAKRFVIEPVRQREIGGKEFQGWDRSTKAMPAGAQPQGTNASDAAEKRVRYWQEWIKKSETQRAELTINEEDGR